MILPALGTRRGTSLEQATTYYERTLHLALPYLESRGITEEIARKYRLGVVERPCSGHERYQGRLSLPYLTPSGVVSLRFRLLDGEGSKYLSLPGDKGSLYNVRALFAQSDAIAVTEGELDALIVQEHVGVPAVGLPGVNLWKPLYENLFKDFERVLVVGDGDTAGRQMTERLCEVLDNAVPVVMPDGMDCTDLFLAEGVDGLKERLK